MGGYLGARTTIQITNMASSAPVMEVDGDGAIERRVWGEGVVCVRLR